MAGIDCCEAINLHSVSAPLSGMLMAALHIAAYSDIENNAIAGQRIDTTPPDYRLLDN